MERVVPRVKIFETIEAVPSRVLGLVRLLAAAPGGDMSREELIELIQPRSLRRKEKEEADHLATETIASALEMGLVEEAGKSQRGTRLTLCSGLGSFRGRTEALDQALPSLIAGIALQPKLQGRTNKFAQICAWFMLQSPAAMPQGHEALKSAMEVGGISLRDLGLRNDTRWDMVVYWAKYLGLMWQRHGEMCRGLVADPSTFIRSHLSELLPQKGATSADSFREQLGKICPVLDGGEVHRQLAKQLEAAGALHARTDESLSDALSFSLRYLKREGLLNYWCPDDQRTFLLMSRGEKVAFLSKPGMVDDG